VVTHAFSIGRLVRHACAAPPWRWLGLNHGHAALTVLRYFTDRPPTQVGFDDMSHLPAELRWTGFPAHMRI
jgi:probable phosphoglycerate mutase